VKSKRILTGRKKEENFIFERRKTWERLSELRTTRRSQGLFQNGGEKEKIGKIGHEPGSPKGRGGQRKVSVGPTRTGTSLTESVGGKKRHQRSNLFSGRRSSFRCLGKGPVKKVYQREE